VNRTIARRLTFAIAVLAGAGLIWLSRHAPPFREVSDGAILEIYTLEALRGRLLVGPYSRFGWHHPGPLYFYLEAPWYWLSGRHTAGMQAGALALNIAAVATVAWAATSASTIAVIALCGAVGWYIWRTGDMIVSPWNPHVIVLPMLAFVVLTAAFAATGQRRLLPWLLLLGSFLAQTHVAMVPPVALLMLVAVAVQRDAVRAGWPAAAGVALAAWLPAIIEQLTHHPGNITRIVRFFAGTSAGQPIATAAAAWSAALTGAFRPDFAVALGFDVRPPAGPWPLAWSTAAMGALVVAALRARARRDAFAMWLAVMCAAISAIALVATTRIRDQIVDHEVFWISALGAVDAAAIVAALGWPRGRRPLLATTVAAALVVSAAAVGLSGMRHVLERPRTTDDHSVDVLAAAIERYITDSRVRRPLIHIEQQIWPIAAGALLTVHKKGVGFAVDDQWTTMFGAAFAANGREDAQMTLTGSARQPRIVTGR
jgi:hypothetical protein